MRQPVYPNPKLAKAFGSMALLAVVMVEFMWISPVVAFLGYAPFLGCCAYRGWYSFKQGCTGYGWLMVLAGVMMAGVYVASYIFFTRMHAAG